MGALDAAKTMCAENKQEKYLKDGWQSMGRGGGMAYVYQFTGNAEIVNLPCKQCLIFVPL